MSTDRIEFVNPPGDDTARLHNFQRDMIDGIASTFGLPVEYFDGRAEMTKAEAEARVAAYREKHGQLAELWDRTVLQAAVNNAVFFVAIPTPRDMLRLWRWEMGRTITKRQYRRLRGRVKAGKRIPEPPAVTINFDVPSNRKLAPFVSPLRG